MCVERDQFSSAFRLTQYDVHEGFCPPHPSEVHHELQKMFETLLPLESGTADAVWEEISPKVREMANDEHLHFDWETFQETAGIRVGDLREQGSLVDFKT